VAEIDSTTVERAWSVPPSADRVVTLHTPTPTCLHRWRLRRTANFIYLSSFGSQRVYHQGMRRRRNTRWCPTSYFSGRQGAGGAGTVDTAFLAGCAIVQLVLFVYVWLRCKLWSFCYLHMIWVVTLV